MEEKIDGFFNETLKYMGKMLKNSGTTKENKEWKIWSLSFDVGGQFPWKCDSWDKLSDKGLQLTDMVEGNYYALTYVKKPFQSQHGPKVGKNLVIVKNAQPGECTKDSMGRNQSQGTLNAQPAPLPAAKVSAEGWVQFVTEYNQIMNGRAEKTSNHMLGTYVVNKMGKQFGDLIALCKKNCESSKE